MTPPAPAVPVWVLIAAGVGLLLFIILLTVILLLRRKNRKKRGAVHFHLAGDAYPDVVLSEEGAQHVHDLGADAVFHSLRTVGGVVGTEVNSDLRETVEAGMTVRDVSAETSPFKASSVK